MHNTYIYLTQHNLTKIVHTENHLASKLVNRQSSIRFLTDSVTETVWNSLSLSNSRIKTFIGISQITNSINWLFTLHRNLNKISTVNQVQHARNQYNSFHQKYYFIDYHIISYNLVTSLLFTQHFSCSHFVYFSISSSCRKIS